MSDFHSSELDTIAALSTAPGFSGLGVIRMSGASSFSILERVFTPTNSGAFAFPDRKAVYGFFVNPVDGKKIDDGLAVVMRGPNSYTGEDVVEISLHGSPVILDAALKAMVHCGARPAQRGEFTRRAFLNGKLDLIQAEAVADLIMATTPSAVEEARARLDRRMSSRVMEIISDLTDIIAEIEVGIDFSEDMDFGTPKVEEPLAGVMEKLEGLLESSASGRLRREGLRVAIVGKPNVGKSTLFNALLGEERMIATPYPGTTRDAVSERILVDGMTFVICDTAGLRDKPEPIEEEGIRRTRQWLENSDLALLLIDSSRPLDYQDEAAYLSCGDILTIPVYNKTDLPSATGEVAPPWPEEPTPVRVSALTGKGLENLRASLSSIGAQLLNSSDYSTTCGLNQRGVLLVEAAAQKLSVILSAVTAGHTPEPEILSLDLTQALKDLREITGENVDELALNRIFERFCVGK
ncbi:MAG: tRNA uridine-5-carboxymethylaminomethyl(34) synthesis GTPase MnmE [Pseudomonadota bacterium]